MFEMGRDIAAWGRVDDSTFKAQFARADRTVGQRRVTLPAASKDKVE
jgi:hypothetical protein